MIARRAWPPERARRHLGGAAAARLDPAEQPGDGAHRTRSAAASRSVVAGSPDPRAGRPWPEPSALRSYRSSIAMACQSALHHRDRPRRHRGSRPGGRDRLPHRRVLGGRLAHRETQRGTGRRGGDDRLRRRRPGPAAGAAVRRIDDRQVPRPQRAGAAAAGATGSTTSGRRPSTPGRPASGPCTTSRGAARPGRRSTSCTPRTPAGCWSNWCNRRQCIILGTTPSALRPRSRRAPSGTMMRMSSNEWLPAQIPFDLVRRGFAPDQVTAHLERLEYDLRIATANGDATNQRLSEVSAQLHTAQRRGRRAARAAGQPGARTGLDDGPVEPDAADDPARRGGGRRDPGAGQRRGRQGDAPPPSP